MVFSLALALIFIGGFVFHIFWEGKGQYTIPYFVLLFPYAVMGLDAFSDWILMIRSNLHRRNPLIIKDLIVSETTILFSFILVVCAVMTYVYSNTGIQYLTEDTGAYIQYLEEQDICNSLSYMIQ